MKLRRKNYPKKEFLAYLLNTSALNEVLTGDDSEFFKNLECYH